MLTRFPRLQNVVNGLGLLALVACLLLSVPGIETARAGNETRSPVRTPSKDASPDAPDVFVPAERDGQLEMAPRRVDPRTEGRGDVITLNTRGYNYGPDRPTARPVLSTAPAAAAPASPDEDEARRTPKP